MAKKNAAAPVVAAPAAAVVDSQTTGDRIREAVACVQQAASILSDLGLAELAPVVASTERFADQLGKRVGRIAARKDREAAFAAKRAEKAGKKVDRLKKQLEALKAAGIDISALLK